MGKRKGGPRTDAGKAVARRNGIKHGLTATLAVVPELGERAEDLEALKGEYKAAMEPVGRIEGDLVRRLAELHWRRERATRAEVAAWRMSAGKPPGAGEPGARVKRLVADGPAKNWQSGGLALDGSDPDRLEAVARVLSRAALLSNGRNRDLVLALLKWVYGDPMDDVFLLTSDLDMMTAARYLQEEVVSPVLREMARDGREPEADRELLKVEAAHLTRQAEELRCLWAAWDELHQAVAPVEDLEKLARYEAHLSREYDRTMDRLERLQRARGGEYVPAPVRVAVDLGAAGAE